MRTKIRGNAIKKLMNTIDLRGLYSNPEFSVTIMNVKNVTVNTSSIKYTESGVRKSVRLKDVSSLPQPVQFELLRDLTQERLSTLGRDLVEQGGLGTTRGISVDKEFVAELKHARSLGIELDGSDVSSEEDAIDKFDRFMREQDSSMLDRFYHNYGADKLNAISWAGFVKWGGVN